MEVKTNKKFEALTWVTTPDVIILRAKGPIADLLHAHLNAPRKKGLRDKGRRF
jgi:hypothetical protein